MRSLVVSASGLIIASAIAASTACGSSASNVGQTGGGGGATSTSTTSSAAGGHGGSDTVGGGAHCVPACTMGTFCSVTNKCIDDGTCADSGDCMTAGTICDLPTKKCVPGGCASTQIPAEAVPPNLLIVLDRSCSMTDKVGAVTKWDIAVGAINKLVTTYAGKVRFGLTLFPDIDGMSCAQSTIPVPVMPGSEMAISTLLTSALKKADQYFPDGPCVTNIDTAVQQAATEPAFNDKMRSSYALLLTDGKQSACNLGGGNAGTLSTITQLATNGVHTFVVGFGSGVDVVDMNKWAAAGLEPNMGANQFYDASDQATLDATFAAIASKTIGCVFQLMSPPPDPNQLYCFFDAMSVMRDPTHMKGWDYDAATDQVTFYGQSCDDLKQGKVKKVDVVYGCDAPPK